jgi:hypothetical protein
MAGAFYDFHTQTRELPSTNTLHRASEPASTREGTCATCTCKTMAFGRRALVRMATFSKPDPALTYPAKSWNARNDRQQPQLRRLQS